MPTLPAREALTSRLSRKRRIFHPIPPFRRGSNVPASAIHRRYSTLESNVCSPKQSHPSIKTTFKLITPSTSYPPPSYSPASKPPPSFPS
ncbi:hypothetical protein AZE42_12231 [Rhizopogon vesiculosus]|uniref:Uncharacterized protein n=1 Tax=Rhizopogon vesiculosus TaxID=180088 RepID=A0A1J8QG16_9AGAM|nr:hypothetical protein AZE42_12231 [Rhizopogon vesiculosus]